MESSTEDGGRRAGTDGDRAVSAPGGQERSDPGISFAAGLVVVDKSAGMTSHDVVGRCRRIFGTRKVGHAGTLDPMATGVLVVADAANTLTPSAPGAYDPHAPALLVALDEAVVGFQHITKHDG